MAAPRPKTLIKRWAREDPDLEIVEDADVLLLGAGGVEIEVDPAPDGFSGVLVRDRITVPHHTWEALGSSEPDRQSALGGLVAEVAVARAGLLRGSADGTAVSLEHPVRADGLSHHALAGAIAEVVKAHRSLEAALIARAREQTLDVGELFRESAGTELQETAPTEPAPAREAWRPTHVVPQGGVSAYAKADPSASPVTSLAPGLRLRALREWGAWVEVMADNGWRGWVDGRTLVRLR